MNTAARSYLSSSQTDRVDRILETTKRLLVEKGVERITMRSLAAESRVSPATLYNRFGSRDNVITLAVIDHYERTIRSLVVQHGNAPTPLDRALITIQVINDEAMRSPAFPRALMKTYFKLDADRTMPDQLHQAHYQTWFPTVSAMAASGALRPWFDAAKLTSELCDCVMSVMVKWSWGVVPDKQLLDQLRFSILLILLGASRGRQAETIEQIMQEALARLRKPTPVRTQAKAARKRADSL